MLNNPVGFKGKKNLHLYIWFCELHNNTYLTKSWSRILESRITLIRD